MIDLNPILTTTVTFLASMALAIALMPLCILWSKRLGLVDRPGPRKVHHRPTPRIGGAAMIPAAAVVAGSMLLLHGTETAQLQQLITVLVAGLFIFIVGLVDDVRTVSSQFKLLAVAAAAAAVAGTGIRLDSLYLGNTGTIDLGWAAWPVTILFVLTVTTAIAFIDGLDGLAVGLVMLAAAAVAVPLLLAGHVALAILPLSIIGASVGFWFFNRHPAKVFMGDSGSLSLGFLIAVASLAANPAVGSMRGLILPGLALSVPLIDTAVTMFRRRFIQRRSIFAAERGHIHHHLIDTGLRHQHAVWAIHGVSLLAVGIGALSITAESWATLGILALNVPLLFGLFRFAGSVRTRAMLHAVRKTRHLDRQAKDIERVFEDMQLHFRQVHTFSEWWQRVCKAADAFELARLELPIAGRDGKERTLIWVPVDEPDPDLERMSVTLPVRQRRGTETLEARLEVLVGHSLEAAGRRIAMFSRLMQEHSVAEIQDPNPPTTGRHRLQNIAGYDRIAVPEATPASVDRPWAGPTPILDPNHPMGSLRIAVVHDFLYTYAGAERVLEQIIDLYPHCDVFSLFDFVPPHERHFLRGKPVMTSFLQKMPLARSKHRAYLPLMPLAIEQLDLSGYDLVISSSYTAAKGVITGPDQLHICYCHSPVRYAWDLQHQYLNRQGLGFGPKGLLARAILHYLRTWDVRSSKGVDVFVANSRFIARRIEKTYRRDAKVIYPPVDVDRFKANTNREDYYLTASRMVPYKRIDLIIEAFNRMPDKKLVVVGSGPDFDKLADMAGPNVELTGYLPDDQLTHRMQRAKAFVFAAEEDFGIVPVEAMAAGTPVIAYGKGGVTVTVIDGQTGVLFPHQHAQSLVRAVEKFENQDWPEPSELRNHSNQYAISQFAENFAQVAEQAWKEFKSKHRLPNHAKQTSELESNIDPNRSSTDEANGLDLSSSRSHDQA